MRFAILEDQSSIIQAAQLGEGDLAEVVEWDGDPDMVGEIVTNADGKLVWLGHTFEEGGITGMVSEHKETLKRLRVLQVGELIEITE